MIDAFVLDVGHAGCTIVRTEDRTIVVDAGTSVVANALEHLGIYKIDHLILTHRHRDHTSGAYVLLSDPRFTVGRLYVNPNPGGKDLRRITMATNLAWSTHRTVKQDINVTTTKDLSGPDLSIEILWPDLSHSNEGVGGSVEGASLGPHDLAVVARISAWSGRSVLLCADADRSVFEELIKTRPDSLQADALVYPHHGGLSSAGDRAPEAEKDFAERLTRAVGPALVVFSNGRTRFDNPRAEVIHGVRAAGSTVRIACTQINARCGGPIAGVDRPLWSMGSDLGHSCAGTIGLALDSTRPLDARETEHGDLIGKLTAAQCQL